jgi:hypothetical protein
MGLSWTAQSMKDYGVEKMLDKHFRDKHRGRRAIASSRKIMEGWLMLIAGGEKFEFSEKGGCEVFKKGQNQILEPLLEKTDDRHCIFSHITIKSACFF